MSFFDYILEKASPLEKNVCLCEGSDLRILEAGKIAIEKNIASITILGNPENITHNLEKLGADLDQITIIDPQQSEKNSEYAEKLYEIRKAKGMTLEMAQRIVLDNVYFGTMMVKCGDADGLVGGAIHSSADMIRPALQIIKPAEGFKTISSSFFMCRGEETYIFADCALVERPTSAQLSEIAIATAITGIKFGIKPKIAMLSFSTKGSGKSEAAIKIAHATNRTKDKVGALFGYGGPVVVDGELQFDAAFVPSVAELKCPDSPLHGQANTFIFPDLESGNICYKAVQRLGKFDAFGPVLQGLDKPVNDLSRGSTVEDIVGTIAITAIQAY